MTDRKIVEEKKEDRRLYRRRGEKDEQFNFSPTVSYGGGSVMVWSGICLGARTELVVVNGALNADGYIRVLQEQQRR